MVTILGPTASGKTSVAAHLAAAIGGEVISADSRQVYRGMNLGTGKDYDDYIVDGKTIPYHLIDIADAGTQYNVFEYQRDFLKVFDDISFRGKFPVLCGGSGLYLEAVLNNYRLVQVPHNEQLRTELSGKPLDELTLILKKLKPSLHNTTDIVNEKRAVRAIEIEMFLLENPQPDNPMPDIRSLNIGIRYDRQTERNRITTRLKQRLEQGLVEEVRQLLKSGLTPEALTYYGLEYKFLTAYIEGQLTYEEMFGQLNTAIHQFAKRQMTWFRRMEKNGTIIHWINGGEPLSSKINSILALLTR